MTTHWQFTTAFASWFPRVNLQPAARFIQDRNLWSSAGVSAGIDMSLALVKSELGVDAAKRVQMALQYCPEPPFECSDLHPAQVPIPDC